MHQDNAAREEKGEEEQTENQGWFMRHKEWGVTGRVAFMTSILALVLSTPNIMLIATYIDRGESGEIRLTQVRTLSIHPR